MDAFLNFLIFPKKREARTGTEPAGEISGGLHNNLSHSDVGPRITNESRNFEKPLQQNF